MISCRLRNHSSSDYIVNGKGSASNFNNNNNGNFFIGAINDGGEGTHNNANVTSHMWMTLWKGL